MRLHHLIHQFDWRSEISRQALFQSGHEDVYPKIYNQATDHFHFVGKFAFLTGFMIGTVASL